MGYQVVFRRNDRDIETLYWTGSLDETLRLARKIAVECAADAFRIIEFPDSGAEVYSEEGPFGDTRSGMGSRPCGRVGRRAYNDTRSANLFERRRAELLRTGSANFSASGERQQDNDPIVILAFGAAVKFDTHIVRMWDVAQPMIEAPAIRG